LQAGEGGVGLRCPTALLAARRFGAVRRPQARRRASRWAPVGDRLAGEPGNASRNGQGATRRRRRRGRQQRAAAAVRPSSRARPAPRTCATRSAASSAAGARWSSGFDAMLRQVDRMAARWLGSVGPGVCFEGEGARSGGEARSAVTTGLAQGGAK
jgi:hypothetical protein